MRFVCWIQGSSMCRGMSCWCGSTYTTNQIFRLYGRYLTKTCMIYVTSDTSDTSDTKEDTWRWSLNQQYKNSNEEFVVFGKHPDQNSSGFAWLFHYLPMVTFTRYTSILSNRTPMQDHTQTHSACMVLSHLS